jgi:hypothetical protein
MAPSGRGDRGSGGVAAGRQREVRGEKRAQPPSTSVDNKLTNVVSRLTDGKSLQKCKRNQLQKLSEVTRLTISGRAKTKIADKQLTDQQIED